jgi:hypothetical protein
MKQGIKLAAIAAFTAFPNAKSVWVSPDEQAFLHESRAKMHNSDSVEVKRIDVMEEESGADPAGDSKDPAQPQPEGVNVVTAKVKTMTSIEELEELKKNDNRKTVQDAIDKRIATLKAAPATQPAAPTEPAKDPVTDPATNNEQ